MNDTVKIPDTRFFKMIELKKKWRLRTAKLSIQWEFDEVITKQRITMFYDFSKEEEVLEDAEKDLSAAKYDSKNQLLDTDDDESMSNKVKRLDERVTKLKQRLETLKEQHKDFTFFWKAAEHKLKVSDNWIVTEIVYQIDKKTIDRFDEMSSHLPNYRMITVDHNERFASQKTWMLDTIVAEDWIRQMQELWKQKEFWQPIQVDWNALKNMSEKDPLFESLLQVMMKINEASEIVKKTQEIFDSLATLYKWRIGELKIILQWRRDALEKIREEQEDDFEKSILSIAIEEAWKDKENWLRTMITLAAWFDFIEILKQYE